MKARLINISISLTVSVLFIGLVEWACSFITPGSFVDLTSPPKKVAILTWEYIERIANEKEDSRNRVLANNLIKWGILKYKNNNTTKLDYSLRNEPGHYYSQGVQHNISLFGSNYLLSPNVDDFFMLKGAVTGRVKSKLRYVINEFSRRDSTFEKRAGSKFNLLMLGCSFTFSGGVDAAESIPGALGRYLPTAQTFNFGVPGSSPARTLMAIKMNKEIYMGGVDQKPAIAIFTFIDDHLDRIVGTSAFLSRAPDAITNEPYFYLDGEELRWKQYFNQDALNFRWMFRIFGKTNFARAFNLKLPVLNEEHFKLTAKILTELKAEIFRLNPNLKHFYVGFFPSNSLYAERLIPYLETAKIPYFDYSPVNAVFFLGDFAKLPFDGHPSKEAYDMYSYLLAEDLRHELDPSWLKP